MKAGRIELTSQMNTAELTRALDGRGVLRVDKEGYEINGVKHVFLRERTLLEAVQDFFTLKPAARSLPALQARYAIESVLKDKVNAGQLLQNIRDRIDNKGNFSGRSIARDLREENRSNSGKIMPLEGGTAVAEKVGRGVHIMQKNPLAIKSGFTIVRAATLPENLRDQAPTNKTAFDYSFIKPGDVPTKNLVVFKDVSQAGGGNRIAQVNQFKEDLKSVLDHAATIGGGVVIEVSRAMLGMDEKTILGPQEKNFISTMIKAVNDSVEEARKNHKQLSVTFAGEDRVLLAIFKSQYEADRLGLNQPGNSKPGSSKNAAAQASKPSDQNLIDADDD